MKRVALPAKVLIAAVFCSVLAAAQQPFQAISVVNERTIAGRAVALDGQANFCRGPCPTILDTRTPAIFSRQWTIIWDQYNRQRLPYYFCCFDFDRTTFELKPD